MRRSDWRLLALIVVVFLVSAWIDWPGNTGLHIDLGPIQIHQEVELRQGLDLQGGLSVLLVADVPEDEPVSSDSMANARTIVENRVNGLGVTEPLVQLQGDRYIVVELPGIDDPDEAIAAVRETGLLEFIAAGSTYLAEGSAVRTSNHLGDGASAEDLMAAGLSETDPVYETVFTGADLSGSTVSLTDQNAYQVALEFQSAAATRFAEYTASHIGQVLAIVLDGTVISSPAIQSAIPDGKAVITGSFTYAEARNLSVQLQYGALPIPFRVEETRTVGPTLGQDSVQKSIRAGIVGLSIVLLFMAVYYRVPGLLADVALITYALVNLALYKTIPVTITLPGITGFLLSTGMAVDANILIFERMKEELRWGRPLNGAIEAGFSRAWTSIRDSNLSVMITCAVLFWFGSNFGATQVKGFAVTLFLGVLVSMFTAITVTRTLVRLVFRYAGNRLRERLWLLGA